MRFYTEQHLYYCGIDLHARSMYACVLDQKGQTAVHRKLPTEPEPLVRAVVAVLEPEAVSPREPRELARQVRALELEAAPLVVQPEPRCKPMPLTL